MLRGAAERVLHGLRALPGWALNCALAGSTTLLVLGLGEGGARLMERSAPSPHVADYIADWDEWDGEFFTATGGRNPREFNDDGLRDRDHAISKLPGTRRVMCLGDSTTYGQHLAPHAAYPQVLQELADRGSLALEVFNVGLAGWSARQELIAYRRICRKYAPDHVILMLCLNDVADMHNNLSRPPEWLLGLHARSALVRLAVGAQRREIRDVRELFDEHPAPSVEEGWSLLFAEIDALRDEVRADGAILSVLVLPFRFQVEPQAPPPRAQQRVAERCASSDIPCLDLLPALRHLGASAFACPDHLSARGARVVAETVLASGLLPRHPRPVRPDLPGTREGLLRVLRGGDASARIAALSALVDQGTPAGTLIPVLLDILARDPNENVRLTAAQMLASAEPGPETLPALVGLLQSSEPARAVLAARVLGSMGPVSRPAVPSLHAALAREHPALRREVAAALGEVGPAAHEATAGLIDVLAHDDDVAARAEAADSLGEIGPKAERAVPALVHALSDASGDVRLLAARSLGRIGPRAQPATSALVSALHDPRPEVRLMAARALPRVGARLADVEDALEPLTRERDQNVRREAKAALRQLRAGTKESRGRNTTRHPQRAWAGASDPGRARARTGVPRRR